MNKTLFAKELRANLFVSDIIAAVLAMYIGMIVSMFDPELGESLDAHDAEHARGVRRIRHVDAGHHPYRLHAELPVRVPADYLHPRADPDHGEQADGALPRSRRDGVPAGNAEQSHAHRMHDDRRDGGYPCRPHGGGYGARGGIRRDSVPRRAGHAGVVAGERGAVRAVAGYRRACASCRPACFRTPRRLCGRAAVFASCSSSCRWCRRWATSSSSWRTSTRSTLFDYYGLAAGDASAVGGAIALAASAVALFAAAVAVFDRRDLSI